jgi:hypothetical protein
MAECNHDLVEREAAVVSDGMCPLCSAEHARALRLILIDRAVRDFHDGFLECDLCASIATVAGANPHKPECVLHDSFEDDMRLVPR